MQDYMVIAPAGVILRAPLEIKLTDAQVALRQSNLEAVKRKKNVYQITGAVSFKRGEVIGLAGKVSALNFGAADGSDLSENAPSSDGALEAALARAEAAEAALKAANEKITELEANTDGASNDGAGAGSGNGAANADGSDAGSVTAPSTLD